MSSKENIMGFKFGHIIELSYFDIHLDKIVFCTINLKAAMPAKWLFRTV